MPTLDPELLSDARILAAYLIFLGSYVVFALGTFPGLKIDRPGAAIIGAVLMVAFRIVDARQALASIDFATLVLLFSMMIVAGNLRLAGFFDWITAWVIGRLRPNHLLPVVIFTCGALSAFLVNDVVVLVMTPMVVQMTRRLGVPAVPYVIAVATASNIGSVATITGNPQNMLIGSLSGVPYVTFLARLGPVALAGLLVNWLVVHWATRRGAMDRVPVHAGLATPAAALRPTRLKPFVVVGLVLAGFFAGIPAAMVAAVGAALLLITRTVDPRRVYDEVDWGLLVFFVGLFVIVGGADRAGLTAALLEPIQAWDLHRLPIFVTATAVLSNLVSNVPAVMLLRTVVPGFPDSQFAWLVLAMASTLAGNLTIAGSVANIITVECAAAEGVRVSFRDYLRVGLPLTIITLVLGTLWLWLEAGA